MQKNARHKEKVVTYLQHDLTAILIKEENGVTKFARSAHAEKGAAKRKVSDLPPA